MRRYLFIGWLFVMGLPMLAIAQDATSVPMKSEGPSPEPSFSTFKEAYSAGNEALKDRKLKEAAAAYGAAENLTTSAKSKSQAANAQGWVFWKDKKLEEAKKAFSRAVEQNGDNKVALKNLGVVSYRMYEYGLADLGALKEAVQNLETSGEDPELLERAKGDLAREQGYAQVTPEPSPKLSQMKFKELCALGDKLQTEGMFDEAMKVFKQAEISASSPDAKGSAVNRQGKLELDTHHPSEAVKYFEQAVAYKPTDKQLKVFLNSLGLSYWSVYDAGKGKGEELKRSVDAFYKMNSIDPSYHHENLEMALDELKEVDPDSAKAYTIKDETPKDETTSEGEKDGDAKGAKTKDDAADNGSAK